MKVLWVTNMVFPEAAEKLGMSKSASGGWLTYFLQLLSSREDIQCEVVSGYHQKKYQEFEIDGIHYHMVPANSYTSFSMRKLQVSCLQQIINTFNPDIIHIHGTEFFLGLCVFELTTTAKIVVNMQTVAQGLYMNCNGGLTYRVLYKNMAIKEILMGKGPIMRKLYSFNRCKIEKKYLQKAKYVIGNTNYDKAYVTENSSAKYYYCPYLYRKEFYEHTPWEGKKIERFSIFTGQAVAPLKGLHKLIECLYYIKREIPEVRLYIPGPDLSDRKMIDNYTYVKYINKLIDKLDLRNNIEFTGVLDEVQMADRMVRSNVVVVPSAMELGSSMVWEAMILGTPIVASFRGGMTENFIHGESGYYYDYNEIFLMKQYILNIFHDVKLAKRFSENERERALKLHDPTICVKNFVNAYKEILQDGGNL